MNFHPEKQLFQVAGTRDPTVDSWITRPELYPYPTGDSLVVSHYIWLICNDISYIGNCSEVDRKRKNRIIIPDWPQHHYSTLAVAVMWLAGVVAAAAVGTVNQNWKFHSEITKYLESRCYTGFPFWALSTNFSFTAASI